MSDEAKRLIAALRARCAEQASCRDCPMSEWCNDDDLCTMRNDAADLIESLSAELEQVKAERDAAVEFIAGDCDYCKHRPKKYWRDCSMNEFCVECYANDYCNWQWRGVQEDGVGADDETR